MKNNNLTSPPIIFLFLFILFAHTAFGQNHHHGIYGGILIQAGNYKIEMVKENYTCAKHSNIQGEKGHQCPKCQLDLTRDKKLIFYLFDKEGQALDVSKVSGRVIIGYGDETQTSKKIRAAKDYMWIPLGKSNLEKIHYASIKIDFERTVIEALFGEKTEHDGHHH